MPGLRYGKDPKDMLPPGIDLKAILEIKNEHKDLIC